MLGGICLDRRDEISMYEPEKIDSQPELLPALSTQAKEHYQLHQHLQKSAEFRNKNHSKLSLDFNDRLLGALQSEQPPKDSESSASLSNQFFTGRSFLGLAAISVFAVGLGIIGYSFLSQNSPAVKSDTATSNQAQEIDQANTNDSASEKSPAPPILKRNEKLAAPHQANHDWADESTFVNPETQLLNQISIETDSEARKSLQQKLLQLYESTGQTEKANRLRSNMKD